jgi:hypothetical protein
MEPRQKEKKGDDKSSHSKGAGDFDLVGWAELEI